MGFSGLSPAGRVWIGSRASDQYYNSEYFSPVENKIDVFSITHRHRVRCVQYTEVGTCPMEDAILCNVPQIYRFWEAYLLQAILQ